MICFTTHNFIFFKRQEVWFYNGEDINKAGYSTFAYTLEKKVPIHAIQEWTSRIDLKKNEDQLYNSISSTFKLHINRALSRNVHTNINFTPSVNDCIKLAKEVNIFAKLKKFIFNKHRIFSIQKTGNICISKAFLGNDNIISHIYLFDDKYIVLLHTLHNLNFNDEKIRSYANKLLHWHDILEFKKRNFEVFDWGGINPENLPGITKFKLSFGGTTEKCYSYIKIASVLKFFVKFYKFLKK